MYDVIGNIPIPWSEELSHYNKTMYSFKMAFILGVPRKAIEKSFPIDVELSNQMQLMYSVNDMCLLRCLSIIRAAVLKNYKHYKNSVSLVNSVLPSFNKTTISQERLDEVMKLSGNQIDLADIFIKKGINEFLNYINDWFEDNIEKILDNNDIPYPKVIKSMFKYPRFNSKRSFRIRSKTTICPEFSSGSLY